MPIPPMPPEVSMPLQGNAGPSPAQTTVVPLPPAAAGTNRNNGLVQD
jgi:hypothetical protein